MGHKVLCLGDASQWMQINKCSSIGKSLNFNCFVLFLVCIVQKCFLIEGIIEVINYLCAFMDPIATKLPKKSSGLNR